MENIGAGDTDGTGIGVKVGIGNSALPPGWNITIDHNTIFSSDHFTSLYSDQHNAPAQSQQQDIPSPTMSSSSPNTDSPALSATEPPP